MGKKKGGKAASSSGGGSSDNHHKPQNHNHASLLPLASTVLDVHGDALYAVIEFHHMLVGNVHKKEAAAIGAAAAHGIVGTLYMGGPSIAVIAAAAMVDIQGWLADCKRAGKEGHCIYWKRKDSTMPSMMNNKLKVMGYAPGKDTKMDTVAYQATLAQLGIPYPLPPCGPFL